MISKEINTTQNIKKEKLEGVSAFSISSIKYKKSIENVQKKIYAKQSAKNDFSEETLKEHWQDYEKILESKGRHSVASIMRIGLPSLEGSQVIKVCLPNETSKKELELESLFLLKFLSEKLQNYRLELSISIDAKIENNYAFTAEEKFEKLKSINSAISILKDELNLTF